MNVNAWHRPCRRNPFRGWQVHQIAPPANVLMPVRSPSTTVTRFDLRHVVGPGNAITSWRMNLVVPNCGFSRTYNWPTNRKVLDLSCKVTFEFPVLLGQTHFQLSYVYLPMVPIVVFIAFPTINVLHTFGNIALLNRNLWSAIYFFYFCLCTANFRSSVILQKNLLLL